MLEQLNSEQGAGVRTGPLLSPEVQKVIIDAFHRIYWAKTTMLGLQWMGHYMIKWPADMFTYAYLIHTRRPDILVETGTYRGGSAQFFADVMNRTGKGMVITIDIGADIPRPPHERILYLEGDSVELGAAVKEEIERLQVESGRQLDVMASLDSDHRMEHVAAELEVYRDIVTPGQYLVVEDTNLNGHPVDPDHGLGPWEAVEQFNDPRYVVDHVLARQHLFSMHTWLRREE